MTEQGYFIGDASHFNATRGYLMGFFMEGKHHSLLANKGVEVAVMDLPTQNPDKPHFHKIGTEVTYVIKGALRLLVGNQIKQVDLQAGQFMVIPPYTPLQNPENEPDTQIVVVKSPSVPDDKFKLDWDAEGYSLWLVPDEPDLSLYTNTIDAYAEIHGTYKFRPHITLLGGIATSEMDAVVATRKIAACTPPIDIVFNQAGTSDAYYRSLYLEAIPSPELVQANTLSRSEFDLPPDPSFFPHLSLLYGSISDHCKKEYQKQLTTSLPTKTATVSKLALYRSVGKVPDWKLIEEINLQG